MSVQAKVFPTTGFETLPEIKEIEEETLPGYSPEDYYPVRFGEVFESRYQGGWETRVWHGVDRLALPGSQVRTRQSSNPI
jgi:hypothetical protein